MNSFGAPWKAWSRGEDMCMRSEREDCHYCGYHRDFPSKYKTEEPRKVQNINYASYSSNMGDIPDYRVKTLCLKCKRLAGVSRHQVMLVLSEGYYFPNFRKWLPSKAEKHMSEATRDVFYGCGLPNCPSCGNQAMQVGFNFRVPSQRDKKAWEILSIFLRQGRYRILSGLETLTEDRPTFRNLLWTRIHVRLRKMHLINLHVNPILDLLVQEEQYQTGSVDDLLAYTYFSSCFRPYRLNHLSLPSSKKNLNEFFTDLVQDISLLPTDPSLAYTDQGPLTFRLWSMDLRANRMKSLWALLRSYVYFRCIVHYWSTYASKRILMKDLVENALAPPHGTLFKEAQARAVDCLGFQK